ncbi:hypothetical protein OGAPHI_006974 [Ogataea philodendri]|uniref:Uncharacterized protein n=1 Tax=Ogataea philodendri TaxID=1378263 RepID=A0A9P8NV09_9ASCO|nr:uncharacterized protein OGAPHI_006974 [Ogataea philodendri]KAH3660388.1 hypothetical protein OGAPHI_006974 [Ogataea philodendri]
MEAVTDRRVIDDDDFTEVDSGSASCPADRTVSHWSDIFTGVVGSWRVRRGAWSGCAVFLLAGQHTQILDVSSSLCEDTAVAVESLTEQVLFLGRVTFIFEHDLLFEVIDHRVGVFFDRCSEADQIEPVAHDGKELVHVKGPVGDLIGSSLLSSSNSISSSTMVVIWVCTGSSRGFWRCGTSLCVTRASTAGLSIFCCTVGSVCRTSPIIALSGYVTTSNTHTVGLITRCFGKKNRILTSTPRTDRSSFSSSSSYTGLSSSALGSGRSSCLVTICESSKSSDDLGSSAGAGLNAFSTVFARN